MLQIYTLICGGLISIVSAQQCLQPTLRKEWRQLTQPEKSAFLNAIQALKARPLAQTIANQPSTWNYDLFVDAYVDPQKLISTDIGRIHS